MISKSALKTWLKRNGFKSPKLMIRRTANGRLIRLASEPFRSTMKPGGTFARDGRLFRVRKNEHEFEGGKPRWTVDISTPWHDFDRWANSTEIHAMPLEEFMKIYAVKNKSIKRSGD